ncbi:MAG: T9SS type A sorting domain-containing protein [Lewinellaceae bacterium]|nr:T9SS type A sorting domain-containing protein [Lewinellaceae bacterium]
MRIAALLLALLASLPLSGQYRCANSELWRGNPAQTPANSGAQSVLQREPIVIPVVVHVVWRSAPENITDAQVESQIEVLNEDFRALNAEATTVPAIFNPVLADMEIEFCLVATTRTQTNVSGIGTRFEGGLRQVCYNSLGGHDAIDPSQYLNIWVAGRTDGACGDAPLPGQTDPVPPAEDGVFIRPDCFGASGIAGPPYNLGRTTTHEIGHWLNLKHLWGEGFEDPLCQTDDMVADTPEQAYSYQDECPTHPSLSCGTADMFMNFMNYTNDACMALFTEGQKERAWAAISTYRPGLLGASCNPVSAFEPQQTLTDIRLFNNPADSWTALQLPEKDIFEIAIFDQLGRLVFIESPTGGGLFYIDTRSFISGIYYIKIRNEGKIHTKKLNIVR